MPSMITALCALLSATLPALTAAQTVFAHVIVGNTFSYNQAQWESDIQLASSYGIDAFALNIAQPFSGDTATQMSYAFLAANNLTNTANSDFKLFFSFDYQANGAWAESDVIQILEDYGPNGAHYHGPNGHPFVSTFEGTANEADWATINSTVGGIYFVPDWTSAGPDGFSADLVDGAFSWNMWPDGPNNISTSADTAWEGFLQPAGKSYMMGVSPWFYTDLPGYNKAWVWRGDGMWYQRWQEVLQILPEFVEIVTWNDYGESHYIGPIVEAGIPSGSNSIGSTDATIYVNGYPHSAWLSTLPYQIAAYKNAYASSNPVPSVEADTVVFWYRTSPASAGTTDATCNDCPSAVNALPGNSPYQSCYAIDECLEDGVFAIVLLQAAGSASIAIGGVSQEFDGLSAGINFISRPFNGDTGNVTVSTSSGVSGEGIAITSEPPDGTANFNAWVGCAGAC